MEFGAGRLRESVSEFTTRLKNLQPGEVASLDRENFYAIFRRDQSSEEAAKAECMALAEERQCDVIILGTSERYVVFTKK